GNCPGNPNRYTPSLLPLRPPPAGQPARPLSSTRDGRCFVCPHLEAGGGPQRARTWRTFASRCRAEACSEDFERHPAGGNADEGPERVAARVRQAGAHESKKREPCGSRPARYSVKAIPSSSSAAHSTRSGSSPRTVLLPTHRLARRPLTSAVSQQRS